MPVNFVTDEELFALLNQGDEVAYTAIYRAYWQRLYLHAFRILQDEDQALDVVQDLFTQLWDKRYSLRVNTSLKQYLYTMVRNQVLNAIEKSKTRERHISSFYDFSEKDRPFTEEAVLFKELVDQIDQEIAKLPPKMRLIFEKSRKEGLSYKEIAEELQISENTVKTMLNRANNLIKSRNTFVAFLLYLTT